MHITCKQARQFILAHQRLLPPRKVEGKAGIMDFIRKVGCVQYDPLDRVGYNSNLVLQARVKNYKPNLLWELLYQDRQLVDGWDKNMAIYPVEDWPYFIRFRERDRIRYEQDLADILPEIRSKIDNMGAVCSSDIEFEDKVGWSWGPTRVARAALESMFFWGELTIHHKRGTRRYYDFASKHLSQELLEAPEPNPTPQEYYQWHIKRRIGSVGLMWNRASDAWLAISGLKSKDRAAAFAVLEASGDILPVEVEDIGIMYIRREDGQLLEDVKLGLDIKAKAAFIAPLDNLLWDRKLIKQLFGFQYTWEVYKPAAQRQYGYYVLPVLYKNKFIARFEPRFNKKTFTLEILGWWWEPNVQVDSDMILAIKECMDEFIDYLGAKEMVILEDAKTLSHLYS